jgi:hypothetical protein
MAVLMGCPVHLNHFREILEPKSTSRSAAGAVDVVLIGKGRTLIFLARLSRMLSRRREVTICSHCLINPHVFIYWFTSTCFWFYAGVHSSTSMRQPGSFGVFAFPVHRRSVFVLWFVILGKAVGASLYTQPALVRAAICAFNGAYCFCAGWGGDQDRLRAFILYIPDCEGHKRRLRH